jgi:alanine racemase
VATLEEGIAIRKALPNHTTLPILCFSGLAPWTETIAEACVQHRLTPVFSTEEDLEIFSSTLRKHPLPFHIKFNTGMNRLGLEEDSLPWVLEKIRNGILPCPEGVLSHLAQAEALDSTPTQRQVEKFRMLSKAFLSLGGAAETIRFHLGNSSATWASKKLDLPAFTQWARPGLSLYGATPWAGLKRSGLIPVLTLKAKVLQTRRLNPGDRVGYGGTYRAKKAHFMAVLGIGYGDGLPRSLSVARPPLALWDGGKKRLLLGRVSMDLITAECGGSTRPGDFFEILGPRIDPWTVAKAAGTVPYELFTSLSPRIERIYSR